MNIKMNDVERAAGLFVIIGAVNWGLYGFFNFDLVQVVFSTSAILKQAFYGIIAASGIYWLYKITS